MPIVSGRFDAFMFEVVISESRIITILGTYYLSSISSHNKRKIDIFGDASVISKYDNASIIYTEKFFICV